MAFGFKQVIPLLRIFDVDKAKEFYCDFLGFELEWEHHFDDNTPAYIQVRRSELTLHLTEHHGDCCPGSKVFIWMSGIRELHEEVSSKQYKYNRPGLDQTFYNALCFEVVDPFGNKISFNEALPEE